MKHSLWVEITLADKYIKFFLKNGILNRLGLTSSEYFVLQLLIEIEKKVSFYELKKIIPLEPKQLHLVIKKLVEKKFLYRKFTKNSSEIWVPIRSKDLILKTMNENHQLLFQHFGDSRLKTLLFLSKEFNDLCRKSLKRERIVYKNPGDKELLYHQKCIVCKLNKESV